MQLESKAASAGGIRGGDSSEFQMGGGRQDIQKRLKQVGRDESRIVVKI